jgi:hypothetical protein
MHEAALAQAALPARTIILGTLLRPYSLGHELFLIRENNPIIAGATITYEELEQAVLICCQTWREYGEENFWGGLKFRLWKWRTWHWRRLLRNQISAETEKFHNYRAAGSLEFPSSQIYQPGRAPGRLPGAPFLLRVHQFLIAELELSHEEAWDYNFGLAKMQWHAFWEKEDACDIENAHEVELKRYRDEEDAKIIASEKAKEAACPA